MLVIVIITIILTEHKHRKFQWKDREIPIFSTDIKFNEYPTTINLENKYDCNAHSLRECKLDDPTTLFGCKELSVQCKHFEKDIEFWENNESYTIPKNIDKNTGYALSISALSETCNPYHGDLILITADPNSNDYMLICMCKNPGLVGNEHILGPCENVYICNGKIDNLNQPIDKISCSCENTQVNDRYENGIPVCRTMNILEANDKYTDWSNLINWGDKSIVAKTVYSPTVKDNVRSSKLLDPCVNSLIEDITIPNAYYNSVKKTCHFKDYGYPVRTNILDTNDPNNDKLGNGVVSGKEVTEFKLNSVDSVLPTTKWRKLRLIDNVGGVRRQINVETSLLPYKPDKTLYVNFPPNVGISDDSQIMITTKDEMYNGKCEGSWPSYDCYMEDYYKYRKYGVPYPGWRPPPGTFLWGTDHWYQSESLVYDGLAITSNGVSINQENFNRFSNVRTFGLQLCNSTVDFDTPCYNGPLSFVNEEDYKKHNNVVT